MWANKNSQVQLCSKWEHNNNIYFNNFLYIFSFDGHLILLALAKKCKNIDVIARGMEAYTAFKTKQFRFIGENYKLLSNKDWKTKFRWHTRVKSYSYAIPENKFDWNYQIFSLILNASTSLFTR